MDLKLDKETYGLFFYNTNNILVLNYILDKYKQKDEFNDVEIVGTWKLFGIHDILILIKAKGATSNLTNFIKYSYSVCKNMDIEINSICSTNDDVLINKIAPDIKKNSEVYKYLSNSTKIIEYWCDPVIPLLIDGKKLANISNNDIYLIMFVKIKKFNVNKLLKINEILMEKKDDIYNDIVGIFQGYGLYDLIFIIKCQNYFDAHDKINILRRINYLKSSIEESLIVLDTASIITVSEKSHDFLRFSALLKINPVSEKHIKINKLKERIEKKILKSNLEKEKSRLIISDRQGFFDLIITVCGNVDDYMTFIEEISHLPFIEDIASIIRYDYD